MERPFDHRQLGLRQLVLVRRHLGFFGVADQCPQAGTFQVTCENDLAAAAPFLGFRKRIERQATLLSVLVVAAEAMFAKDRFDVVVVRNLIGVPGGLLLLPDSCN
jgi:hypothetical protein